MLLKDRLSSGYSGLVAMLIAMAVSAFACARLKNTGRPEYSLVDINKARLFSDATAADLKADRRRDLYKNLEKSFRQAFTVDDVDAMVEQMVQVYGKPIEFEFKQEELGQKSYPEGSTKPMGKFWYAATTTKFQKGSHFLVVEVVPDGDTLAVSSFAIVNFPLGIPENLR